jgi:hypothetical protein
MGSRKSHQLRSSSPSFAEVLSQMRMQRVRVLALLAAIKVRPHQ